MVGSTAAERGAVAGGEQGQPERDSDEGAAGDGARRRSCERQHSQPQRDPAVTGQPLGAAHRRTEETSEHDGGDETDEHGQQEEERGAAERERLRIERSATQRDGDRGCRAESGDVEETDAPRVGLAVPRKRRQR